MKYTTIIFIVLVIASLIYRQLRSSAKLNIQPTPSSISIVALNFKLQEVQTEKSTNPQTKTWLATYESKGKTAKFKIQLDLKDKQIGLTNGIFYRDSQSDDEVLLQDLKEVLQANKIPKGITKIDMLPFEAAILGKNLSKYGGNVAGKRIFAGDFTDDPKGSWIATKAFVGKERGEFFLNIDIVNNVGEIAIKDASYGDMVLTELAKVL